MSDTSDHSAEEPADDTADHDADGEARPDDHLADVEDGCGCAEVWEHLSDQRED